MVIYPETAFEENSNARGLPAGIEPFGKKRHRNAKCVTNYPGSG